MRSGEFNRIQGRKHPLNKGDTRYQSIETPSFQPKTPIQNYKY